MPLWHLLISNCILASCILCSTEIEIVLIALVFFYIITTTCFFDFQVPVHISYAGREQR